ncbi:MAG: DNA-directed RNA polymerase subunit omega [Clostridia bacterium]|nr:DNA-directed RNA polymerase subunit omega [Clostridia bacterium]
MAWINPPIEEVIKKAGNRYALVTVVAKRAKELVVERPEFFRDNQKVKPIELASREFYQGVYTIKHPEN